MGRVTSAGTRVRERADAAGPTARERAPAWAQPSGLVLITSLLVGSFALLASAIALATGLTNDAEWALFALTLTVLAPGALVVGRALARRVDAAAGGEAVSALAAISAITLLGLLVAARGSYALGHRSSTVMLPLALAWAVVLAVAVRRATHRKSIGELLLTRRIGPVAPWTMVAGLLCVASLAFFPRHFFHPGQLAVSLVIAAALVVAHERLRAGGAPRWAGRLLDVAVIALAIMVITDVSGYHEYLRPDARTLVFGDGYPLHPNVLAFFHRIHEGFWLAPLNDMLHGRTLLVDTSSQYGVGVFYFLAAFFEVAPLGYGALGLLTSVLTGLQFALGYGVLRLAGVRRMLAIPAIVAAVLGLVMGALGSFNDFPSTGGLRYGIPWVIVLVTQLAARRPRRHRACWLAAGLLVGIAAVWSFETFAYAGATFTTAAAFDAASVSEGRRWIAIVARRILAVAVLCVALYAMLAVATRLFSGSWPDLAAYLSYLDVYSTQSSPQAVTVPWTPGLVMLLVHFTSLICLAALVVRRHALVTEHRPALAAIAATNGLGIISFSYWVGISIHQALFFMGLPALVVTAIWLSIATAERTRLPAALRLVALAVGLWLAATLAISGWADTEGKWRRTALAHTLPFGGDDSSLPGAVSTLWNNPVSDPRAPVAQAMLDRHLRPGAPALVIMEPELTVETLVRSGRINLLPISHPEQDNLVPDEVDPKVIATVDALRPGTLMLTQPATWNTPVKLPAIHVANGLVRVQRLALDRIRARFGLAFVERDPRGLAIVRLVARRRAPTRP